MKFNFKYLFTTTAALLLCLSSIAPQVEAAANPKALFLYWRGETACEKGLKAGLKDNGVNIKLTEFNAKSDKNELRNYLATVDENQYDFIYTFGTTVSLETAKVIKQKPILFGIVTNPVAAGLIQSWESSGNNVTGVSHAIPYADQVDLFRD